MLISLRSLAEKLSGFLQGFALQKTLPRAHLLIGGDRVNLTKHGFDSGIQNVNHLEAIYELIEGKWKICTLGFVNYFVYDEDIFTSEVEYHQAFLSKKFWSYKNYNVKGKIHHVCSNLEFKKELEF